MTTRRVNRQLWELENLNRAYWDQPLLPEPENGFAEEPTPPYAGLFPTIERWFEEATAGQPHRPRQAKIPREPEIARIARLIYAWDQEAMPTSDPQRAVVFNKVSRLQRSVAEMRTALEEILDLAQPEGASGDPAVGRLIDLWNTAQLAEPYIGPPPKQGRQLAAWHVMASALAPLVSAALVSAGYQRPSAKSDGPVVKVICRALHALERIERAPTAVASYLKRQQKRAIKI
jgi:hypothetical protein